MKTRKAVLAVSAVLLLTSLAVSPVFAETAPLYTKATDLSMSSSDVTALDNFYSSFLNDLAKVKDFNGFHKLVDSYITKWGEHPLLRCLHRYIVRKTIERHILHLQSLRTTAFVISMGTLNKVVSRQNVNFNIYRPVSFWLYSNQGNPFMKSRTFIIDFSPFSIRNVDGRQIGFMRNFYGVYIRSYRPLLGGEHTYFFGHAERIRVFDLSPFN